MAQATVIPVAIQIATDVNNDPVSGAKAYFYAAGTVDLITVYADAALTVPLTNPVIASGAGRFPEMFMAPGIGYDLDIQTPAGVSLPGYPAVDLQSIPLSDEIQNVTGTMAVAGLATQVVYLSDGSGGLTAGSWYLADADLGYASMLPQIGILPADIEALASGTIQTGGRATGFTGLTVGAGYYVSATAGSLTSTAPARPRYVGQADTTTSLILSPNPPVVAGQYQAYTPVLGNTGTVNVMGNGTIVGEYARTGDVIDYEVEVAIGSTTTIGNGTLTISLPIAALSTSNFDAAAGMTYDDSATTFYPITAVRVNGSATTMLLIKPLSGAVTATAPFTFATSDRIGVKGTYRATP